MLEVQSGQGNAGWGYVKTLNGGDMQLKDQEIFCEISLLYRDVLWHDEQCEEW